MRQVAGLLLAVALSSAAWAEEPADREAIEAFFERMRAVVLGEAEGNPVGFFDVAAMAEAIEAHGFFDALPASKRKNALVRLQASLTSRLKAAPVGNLGGGDLEKHLPKR